ncbi:hypothetical protein P691DRAFT_105490 [Macrolepiota fuliginosa MF-IS2]|uniref:Uncharacterized protein n=1 Tax=Macrolepiota fuliginosa MF-IS2 TaxID=1400762 RepID=A0A9P5XAB3_9AGAR|nr:hypothetical protein P691DRAFT_105490 [Macrolepiota fuliginosa MF-IS2]
MRNLYNRTANEANNCFVCDLYGDREILAIKEVGLVARDLIHRAIQLVLPHSACPGRLRPPLKDQNRPYQKTGTNGSVGDLLDDYGPRTCILAAGWKQTKQKRCVVELCLGEVQVFERSVHRVDQAGVGAVAVADWNFHEVCPTTVADVVLTCSNLVVGYFWSSRRDGG